MTSPERRQAPPKKEEDGEGFWEALPHHIVYPLLGFLLGLGSPVGAFALRFALAAPMQKLLWTRQELGSHSFFYAYMGIGTVGAFVLFGYVLGVRSESQRVHNKNLRVRVEQLRIKSVTDGLTGVFSHAYLQENLQIEIARARRSQQPLSLLIIDLDDFKKVNDTHGHLFGDRVLKEITETINMNVRQEDVFGRYGGEEFLVIMPGADAAVAQRVAERIRKAVARAAIVDRRATLEGNGESVRVTISIGLSTFNHESSEGGLELIHRADRSLYRAKKLGKNRVCS